MENKKVILLLSGGIDSTTLLAKLVGDGFDVVALSYNYGQKNSVELKYAKNNAKKYGVKKHLIINLDKILFESSALVSNEISIATYENVELPTGQVNAYVPFRNMLFISSALSLAESMNINEIFLAFNQDDSNNFWDCKTNFVEKINAVVALHSSIKIQTPFINLSKNKIIKLAYQLKVNLQETITCYTPNQEFECGKCLSCITKQKAIENA